MFSKKPPPWLVQHSGGSLSADAEIFGSRFIGLVAVQLSDFGEKAALKSAHAAKTVQHTRHPQTTVWVLSDARHTTWKAVALRAKVHHNQSLIKPSPATVLRGHLACADRPRVSYRRGGQSTPRTCYDIPAYDKIHSTA